MAARKLLSKEQRGRLKRLSPATKFAIKRAFIEWVETAKAEGYYPISEKPLKPWGEPQHGWTNFFAEVDHSALLERILSGKEPLDERPETRYSYPVYPD